MPTFNSLRLLLLAALALANSSSHAVDDASAIRLRGFGTVGMARSSSDQVEFVRDLSQPRGITNHWSSRIDSILGVQVNWQATPEIELIGQAVSRYQYDASRDPELMWAFAKWEPDARVSVRAGRIGADFMMEADSRLVGYSHLAARPSSDFFGPLFFSYFDGADASLTLPLGSGLIRGKVFGGATPEKTSGSPGIWNTRGSPVDGAVLDYFTGPWQFRLNFARIKFASDINFNWGFVPAIDDEAMRTKDREADFHSMGVVYDQGPLKIQAMANQIHQESGVFQNSRGHYLLAGYRVGSVTPYVGLSKWKSNPKGITSASPYVTFVLAASSADQTTRTFGARWDVMSNVALKAQWDSIRGTANSTFPFQNTKAGWNGKTNVLSLVADFVF